MALAHRMKATGKRGGHATFQILARRPLNPWTPPSSESCGDGRREGTPTKPGRGSRINTSAPKAIDVGSSPGRISTRKATADRSGSSQHRRCRSCGIRRSKKGPIPTIRPGRSTSRNASASRWRTTSLGSGSCSISGNSKGASAQSVASRSPRSNDGIAITSSGERKEAVTAWTTSCCSTPTATDRFIIEV